MTTRRESHRCSLGLVLLLAACAALHSGRALAACVYDSSPGKATLYDPVATWQDPDCPTCAPIPLLRIDENGLGDSVINIVTDKEGSCSGTEVTSVDTKSTLGFTIGNPCVDNSQTYDWSVVLASGVSGQFGIPESHQFRDDMSLFLWGDEFYADEYSHGVALFPVTGTYEIRRVILGCGDDDNGFEEVSYVSFPIRVEVAPKQAQIFFNDSAEDAGALLTLFNFWGEEFCLLDDDVVVVNQARAMCSASDPAPSLTSAGLTTAEHLQACGLDSVSWQYSNEFLSWFPILRLIDAPPSLQSSEVEARLPSSGWVSFRRLHNPVGGGESASTNELTLVVVGNDSPTISPTTQDVCTTGTVEPFVVSHTNDLLGRVRYQWQSSEPGTGAFADIPGATAESLDPTLSGSLEYRAQVWGVATGVTSVNLAPNGTATQSSTWSATDPTGRANKARDGNTSSSFWDDSVSHTAPDDPDPWWEVDLGASYPLERVVLWNRSDCCGDRLTNFRVSVLDASRALVYAEDFFTNGTGYPEPGIGFEILLPADLAGGRFVRIELLEPFNTTAGVYLSLAEVQVYGFLECGPYDSNVVSNLVSGAPVPYYPDADGDGYPNTSLASQLLCEAQAGWVPGSREADCNDADPDEHPGQRWYFDGDQDGLTTRDAQVLVQCARPGPSSILHSRGDPYDCNDSNPDISDQILWAEDRDRDGYSTGQTWTSCFPPPGYRPAAQILGPDCDDRDPREYPGRLWYLDDDGDRHGRGPALQNCERPAGRFLAEELVATTDCNDANADYFELQDWYVDADGDGYPLAASGGVSPDVQNRCLPSATHTVPATALAGLDVDCDDADPERFPGQSWYVDPDSDGLGSAFAPGYLACEPQQPSHVSNHRDCDDADPDPTICQDGPSAGSALQLTAGDPADVLAQATGAGLGSFGESDFLVETWIRTSVAGVARAILSKNSVCAPARAWGLSTSVGGTAAAFVRADINAEPVRLEGTTPVTDGEWHHVALRRIDEQISLWVDAVREASVDVSTGLKVGGPAPLVVGNDVPDGADPCLAPFIGQIDDVRIWSGRRDLGSFGPDLHRVISGPATDLQAHWSFDHSVLRGPGGTTRYSVDSAGGFPLLLTIGNLPASTAPIGTGVAQIDVFLASGPAPHLIQDGPGLRVLDAIPSAPASLPLTTRLDPAPAGPRPAGKAILPGAYWIFDLLGPSSQITGDLILEYPTDAIPAHAQGQPGTLALYSRAWNSAGAWTLVQAASNVNPATDQVSFFDVPLGRSQLAIAVDDTDTDLDGAIDFSDNCPHFATPNQTDTDEDGRGDACECTDQNGDGFNNVADLVAINLAIFNPGLVTPLCDGNNDGLCNVADIIAGNAEIFSPTNTSICSRQPVPGP